MPGVEEGINSLAASIPGFHREIREKILVSLKIFCVSEIRDNLLMWSHYSDHHKGAVIRFSCLPDFDNTLCAALPVTYQKEMPVLATIDEWIDSSFGLRSLDQEKMWAQMINVKSKDWAYEKEWRVSFPDDQPEVEYVDVGINPQEIAEVIFGCRMADEDRKDILALLIGDLDHVKAIQATKDAKKFVLNFEPTTKRI